MNTPQHMQTHQRKQYSSDLTDRQWGILEPYIPHTRSNEHSGGAPEQYSKREIVNGILYVKTTGCGWRDLPHDLPPYRTVYHYFNEWSKDGTLEHINTVLRKKLRQKHGKNPDPTVAIIDSQSVKNTHNPAISGYDVFKHTKGVKRTIAVETLGLPLVVIVNAAAIPGKGVCY